MVGGERRTPDILRVKQALSPGVASALSRQRGFDPVRNKSGQAERHEKCDRQLKHGKSPLYQPLAKGPIGAQRFRVVSSRGQNGFIAACADRWPDDLRASDIEHRSIPRKRTLQKRTVMSALGHKETLAA